jgi:hypothetical protein
MALLPKDYDRLDIRVTRTWLCAVSHRVPSLKGEEGVRIKVQIFQDSKKTGMVRLASNQKLAATR